LPQFLPTIGWHAYYGCFGVLGVWMLIALLLKRHRGVARVLIAALALLRGADARTHTWDWGNEWYQHRAANIVTAVRDQLLAQHPTLPRYARVYLGHIPNNVGLVAGQSPAIRVWYRDPTLKAGFYSYYRPRSPQEAAGEDYFFRFDSLRGLVEVRAGPEDVDRVQTGNPDWEQDHENLAMLFLRSGDVGRAAGEFEKLSILPARSDAVVFAAVCRRAAGDSARAESLFTSATLRLGIPRDSLLSSARTLAESLPRPDSRMPR
jgi:hypothetical protein